MQIHRRGRLGFALATLAAATLIAGCDPEVRETGVLVGDSNGVTAAGPLSQVSMTQGTRSGAKGNYLVVPRTAGALGVRNVIARGGGTWRDFWIEQIATLEDEVEPTFYAFNLGINDCFTGNAANYDEAIDVVLDGDDELDSFDTGGVPATRDVFWLTTPLIPSRPQQDACISSLNAALVDAQQRFPNLRVVDWAGRAAGQTAWFNPAPDDFHLNRDGATELALHLHEHLDSLYPPTTTTTTTTVPPEG